MRIAIIAPLVTAIREPQLGGSQAVVADLAAGLQKRGHQVDVYAATGSAIPGVTVVDTGVDAGSLASVMYRPGQTANTGASAADLAFATVYDLVGRVPYDVVHNHAFDPPAVRLASGIRSPVIHTLHLPRDLAMGAAIADARRSQNPPTIAAVSASQGASWGDLAAVDLILPDGVPVERINWSAVAAGGAVFAGRFSPEKGAEDAIAIAREAGVPIDLYGEPYDEDYARSQVYCHRGEAGVRIHGGLTRTALWQVMSEAGVVLCPAKWDEPFGMVPAEAQAAGTPVVAYRRGALPDVVIDGLTGFVVPSDDVLAAARAVGEIKSIERMACRRHAVEHLSLDLSLTAHERLYRQVKNLARAGHHV